MIDIINYKDKFQDNNIRLFNIDNIDFMKQIPDNYYELAIVDPPYGIDVNSMTLGGASIKTKERIGTTKHLLKNILNNYLEYHKIKLFGVLTI